MYTNQNETNVYTGITDTTASASCTGCRHDREVKDSLGRVTRTALMSDPQGITISDMIYGQAGRLYQQTTPYRSTTDPTYSLDTFQYDGLDRPTQFTHIDGNAARTYYGSSVSSNGGRASQGCSASTYGLGYPTLTLDEAGKKKQTWSDGFGRLIEANEPDANNVLNLVTCYKYDANDNQIQVVQGTQTRTYVYDGLSHKTSETQPESGTTLFHYTTSGGGQCTGNPTELCRRVDARNITATYIYDSLDRLTSKTYSDSTPAVSYFYDQSSYNGLTITYGGGRRTGMSDGSGATAWSYDQLGNVVRERRTINGVTKEIAYTYNLDNSVATLTYPSGRVVNYAYSNAGRITAATSGTTNIVNDVSYAPPGAVASAVHGRVSGGFTGITATYTFNNRLQPATSRVTSSNGTVLDFSYSYNLGAGVNNGSVTQIANNLDASRTQSFTYDELNRASFTLREQARTGCSGIGEIGDNRSTDEQRNPHPSGHFEA